MYHLQIISRDGVDIPASIREAIEEERIKSFEIERIRGGLRLRHKKFKGGVHFTRVTPGGPSLVTVRSPDPSNEWQLLEKFIWRIVYHFADDIRAINIQVEAASVQPRPKTTRRRHK